MEQILTNQIFQNYSNHDEEQRIYNCNTMVEYSSFVMVTFCTISRNG